MVSANSENIVELPPQESATTSVERKHKIDQFVSGSEYISEWTEIVDQSNHRVYLRLIISDPVNDSVCDHIRYQLVQSSLSGQIVDERSSSIIIRPSFFVELAECHFS